MHGPEGDEMTRATKNIVSAYQRDRVFVTTLYANESRELVTEFSGVLPPVAVTYPIVKATWDTWDTTFAPMSEPEIDGTRVKIRIKAQYSGRTRIRVDATASDGNVYSAWHVIRVESAPYFSNGNFLTGPSHLEATTPEPT